MVLGCVLGCKGIKDRKEVVGEDKGRYTQVGRALKLVESS